MGKVKDHVGFFFAAEEEYQQFAGKLKKIAEKFGLNPQVALAMFLRASMESEMEKIDVSNP